MPRGLKWYYKAAIIKSATPNVKFALVKNRTRKRLRLGRVFFENGPLINVRLEMLASAKEQTLCGGGGGGVKCEVKREMCTDLLSSPSDTPTPTR